MSASSTPGLMTCIRVLQVESSTVLLWAVKFFECGSVFGVVGVERCVNEVGMFSYAWLLAASGHDTRMPNEIYSS